MFNLYGIFWEEGFMNLDISCPNLEKISAIISSDKLSVPFYFFSFSWTFIIHIFIHLMISHSPTNRFYSFSSLLLLLFIWLDDYKWPDFCFGFFFSLRLHWLLWFIKSDVQALYWIFHFSDCIHQLNNFCIYFLYGF